MQIKGWIQIPYELEVIDDSLWFTSEFTQILHEEHFALSGSGEFDVSETSDIKLTAQIKVGNILQIFEQTNKGEVLHGGSLLIGFFSYYYLIVIF